MEEDKIVRKWISLLLLLPILAFASTIHHYRLNNGLNLFVKVEKRSPVVISQIWYKVGGSYEYNGITGISHVLEHTMFRGTKKYPAGYFSKTIEKLGGVQNAMTASDYTVYYQIVPAKDLATCFKLEADRIRNLALTGKNLAGELKIVNTEKRLRIDNSPIAKLFTALNATAFISNPYHHPVIGWQNDLDNLTLSDVKAWYQRFYHPNNADIVVVGDVTPAKVLSLAKQYFSKIPFKKINEPKPRLSQKSLGQRSVTLHIPAKLPIIVLAYNVPSYKSTQQKWQVYALTVLSDALGGSSSSILTNTLVRQQKIAVEASANYDPYQLHSTLFSIVASPTTNNTLQKLKLAISKEIQQLKSKPLTNEQLSLVKTQIQSSRIYSLDSLSSQAMAIGGLVSRNIPWQEYDNFFTAIDKVTAQQVQAVAKLYLNSDRLTIATLIPKQLGEKNV